MLDSFSPVPLVLGLLTLLPRPPAAAQDSVPRFETTACPFETELELEGVDCGELVVWENRDRPEEGTLRLAVAILRSTAEKPEFCPEMNRLPSLRLLNLPPAEEAARGARSSRPATKR